MKILIFNSSIAAFYRLISSILIFSVLIFACEKPQSSNNNATIFPNHCKDGIINGNELDTDCGGDCVACGTITAPCNPTLNSASLTGTATSTFYSIHPTFEHGNYVISCLASTGGDMYITLEGDTPRVDRAYRFVDGTGPATNLERNQAVIQMNKGFAGSFYAGKGKLYVKIVNGKPEITFCNVTFSGDQTSGNFIGSGRVLVE